MSISVATAPPRAGASGAGAGRLSAALARGFETVAALAIVMMMLHTVANALLRSVFNAPMSGTIEYVGFWYLPLVAFFGFLAAQQRDGHIEARLLFDRMPRRVQAEMQVAANLLTAGLCFGFAYYGWQEAVHSREIGLTGGVSSVVIWPVLFVVPVVFALLAVFVVVEAVLIACSGDPQAGRGVRPGPAAVPPPDGATDATPAEPR